MCSQDELEKLRKKNTLLKEQLKGIKGHLESIYEEEITSLIRKIEHTRIV